ncbi:hypothetical protein CHGG_04760 [Chaetomium globosum CBS 148.51]|uniref:Uncharacterized protein n=1 Tax=Chaetomium globosum (strain ATCC 6205 / CBS 148.51 / DSM 1962 / NBRC 6347 / NRRL 1970) TaxID=306901 RepID=Q2H0D6_CHAGB|nr:uncharacterized protein CHGG_04760 [Chaetomium globosum CBS 148.51]EAQ88141.1 hypothetical protein CHGG_04760 [Chaetomium globosum CBS 148.51]
MLERGVQPHLAYLVAGFIGDLAASTVGWWPRRHNNMPP